MYASIKRFSRVLFEVFLLVDVSHCEDRFRLLRTDSWSDFRESLLDTRCSTKSRKFKSGQLPTIV